MQKQDHKLVLKSQINKLALWTINPQRPQSFWFGVYHHQSKTLCHKDWGWKNLSRVKICLRVTAKIMAWERQQLPLTVHVRAQQIKFAFLILCRHQAIQLTNKLRTISAFPSVGLHVVVDEKTRERKTLFYHSFDTEALIYNWQEARALGRCAVFALWGSFGHSTDNPTRTSRTEMRFHFNRNNRGASDQKGYENSQQKRWIQIQEMRLFAQTMKSVTDYTLMWWEWRRIVIMSRSVAA